MIEKKRKFHSDNEDKIYRFQVLLPNGISVKMVKRNPKDSSISLDVFVEIVKEKCYEILRQTEDFKNRRKIFWNSKELYLEDSKGFKIRSLLCYDKFKPNKTHYLRLFDGGANTVDTFENMWDLTPDTDLLTELPEDYTFETALADLIDNSLQAVWSNGDGERKLISVEVYEDKISVFDTGPGMDGSDENSIVKWGKMGASVHRTSKKLAIGGKPPYLTPFFGMFGYGGTIASMHLGRHAVVSAKTKQSKKVYWLRLERDALLRQSGSDLNWKASGGLRDPSDREIELSPHGSFTKIVMKPKLELPDIFQLQCKLKDIYFPYIQCDEISKTGRTTILVDFEINGINLAEVEGGEVAVTNLHSSNGPDFVLNLHFSFEEDKAASKSPTIREGNARLKCVYFPNLEGKESIDKILEKLNSDGCRIQEDYESFSRISIRRLGRLLPEARWDLLPFMKPRQKKGSKVETLKRCCPRVKCFIDTDAGFNPIPSKTDLAPHDRFTKALKDLGGHTPQKEKVKVRICRGEKQLTLQQLEQEYQNWILQMHSQYDNEYEINCGDEKPDVLVAESIKELGITCDVVRVLKAISWKGRSWNRGQKVKILKGACSGCHKNNLFATLEYFLLEGLEEDTGGEARIICRPLGVEEEDGSVLKVDATNRSLELRGSISLPIVVMDPGKCIPVSDNDWNCQVDKLNLKLPSSIDVLGPKQCEALEIDGGLLTDASVSAGTVPPKEVVAVLRPSNFTRSSASNDLDQKYIVRDNYEMCLDIKFKTEAAKCPKVDHIFSGTVTNTSRNGRQGLYIFLVGSIPSLFQKAGVYSFSFSLKKSATASSELIVRVKASSNIKRWELSKDDLKLPLRVSIPCQVFPGPLRFVNILSSESSKSLLPKQVVEDLKVEVLDRHSNHVQQGIEVELQVHGFSFLDQIGLKRKVDDHGFIDLSGLLKVTEGFGKLVSLTVICNKNVVANKKFQVEKRELKMVTVVPKLCHLGSKLKNLAFEVVNSKGDVDHTIHDSYKHGRSDTLRLKTDFPGFDDSLRYAFKLGRCVIPSITLPLTEGTFCIEANHCQHLELCAKFEIRVSRSTSTEKDTLSDLRASDQLYLKDRSASGSVSDAIKPVTNRKRSALRDSEVTVPYVEECDFASPLQTQNLEHGDRLPQSSYGKSTSGKLSILIESKMQKKQVTVPYVEEECDFASPLQTQNPEHGDCLPQSSDGKSTSGKLSILIESKMQKKQANITQTPDKQPDQKYGLNSDIFNSPEGMMPFADTCTPERAIPSGGPGLEDFESIEEEIYHYGSAIKDQEEALQWCLLRKDEIEEDLTQLQASMELLPVSQPDCSSQKEVVLGKIEEKVDSAASIYGIVTRNPLLKNRHPDFIDDVVGLVALLATVSTPALSCSLAEYLGEDQMLAIVCQSSVALTSPEKYEYILMSLAGELGKCIKNRQLIICLEDLKAYGGDILETDPQRRLALPNPILPEGTTPHGFLGYAVNMIDIDVDHLQTRTYAGHGLRETLFYRLFGELQVYDTKEHMKHARGCITTDGAISLDGLIMRGRGIVSLGSSEKVSVHFPSVSQDSQLVVSSGEVMNEIEKRKSELCIVEKAIICESEKRCSYLKLFSEKKAGYLELLENKEREHKVLLSQQLSKKSPIASFKSSLH
ncbi:hypothetical protein BVRB_3g051850 isoform C [Beta vulgaris subsp. vulgaris]|nr:hypothetical protein BVRB_3g051850 isoform C [Beta vulgaris subsp. vulgaris]